MRDHAVIHPDLPNVPNVGYMLSDKFFFAGDAFTVPDKPVKVLAVPVGAAWMKMSEAVDWLRVVRPEMAVPVHDHGNVFAEWINHLLEQLSPIDTTITVLNGEDFTDF
jgi:L-ascorbate metabolism protein UlaG (beta-lactamase superfamily)